MNVKNRIVNKIKKNSNRIRLDQFISLALYNSKAYYSIRSPIGIKGDFTTSPEISQLFGEMIGLFILNYWKENIKSKFNLVELGPGRFTLLEDILRVIRLDKDLSKSIEIFLIEKNKKLIKFQKNKAKLLNLHNVVWYNSFKMNSNYPCIIYANEFFDCIPIRQFYKKKHWYEKLIKYDDKLGIFSFIDSKVESKKLLLNLNKYNNEKLAEISIQRKNIFKKLCKHIHINKGLIIIVDYGYIKPINNFTLQTVSRHKKTHIFENIGLQDITSLVNFDELINIAKDLNLNILSYSTQREFLILNGILERKKILEKQLSKEKKILFNQQFEKIVQINGMGNEYKVLVVSS